MLNNPFLPAMKLSALEEDLLYKIKKSKSKLFKQLQSFYENYEQYYDDKLKRFENEMPYYMAFLKFENKMINMGCHFCVPDTDNEESVLSGCGKLKELSELDTNVVSMRACIADNDYHRRTYKIIRDKAQDIAYAGDIVEKYQLTYGQLKRYMVVRK